MDILQSELENSELLTDESGSWLQIFDKAYEDVVQNIPDNHDRTGGLIDCRAYRSVSKQDYYEQVLERLPEQIDQLKSYGYKPGDIAILVRKQEEGSMVARKLLDYNLKLISNESVIISGNNGVLLIIGLLRYFIFPYDQLVRAELKYAWYLFAKNSNLPLKEVLSDSTSVEHILPDELVQKIPFLKKMQLYEMIEWIIQILGIGKRSEDTPYIQSLQDMIVELQRDDPISIYSFINYWDEKGFRKSLSFSEEMDAIRIMTIHKAKGLQFKAVIIPFCNWEITTDPRKENILWCDTSDTVFDNMPLVPVRFSSKLKQSVFNLQYAEELVKGYLDNLNLLYVACTRSVEALFIGIPYSEQDRIANVGDLVLSTFNRVPVREPFMKEWGSLWKEDHFVFGSLGIQKPETEQDPKWKFDQYPVFIRNDKLRVRLKSDSYFVNQDGAYSTKVEFGNIMHEIFSEIGTVDDVEEAVQRRLKEGLISMENASELVESITRNLSQPEVSDWFKKGVTVMNEREIIMAGGGIYRPDRVVIDEGSPAVIDFKFGSIEKKGYISQVERYCMLLEEMGYCNVTGFIWYVSLNKIVNIEK